ncbi:hypothetical protein [Cupriavidus sp. UME77]|uniref:hypothetical protein n=1 Tax=Cupriavidus sp. UME77 TaxID=1862321 RepID=UPI0016020BED|nr:hypothetical protein [Cupriavidus sp. UME77]
MRTTTLVLTLCACAFALAGCAAKYQEPTSGERARLRVVNTGPRVNTNVFLYPNAPAAATCFDSKDTIGRINIALLDWDNALHKHKQGVSIGIPGNEEERSERFAETYIPANQSFTFGFGGGGTLVGVGGSISVRGGCSSEASWVPQAGVDYEASYDWKSCRMTVSTISTLDATNQVVREPANVKYLSSCNRLPKPAK